MSLTLYFHPLSSFCQKVLVALYENGATFTPRIVDLGDAEQARALKALWPIGKFPVLRDEARNRTIAESSLIIEYLDRHHPGAHRLLPEDAELLFETRAQDRVFDLYVEEPMQKIVGDRRRPADAKDPLGVEQARARLTTAYGMIDGGLAGRTWAIGQSFTMADCGAAPALFYANLVEPFGDQHANLRAYYGRLSQRPSYVRVRQEAEPYFGLFPKA
jgi:glutathione S-transferase